MTDTPRCDACGSSYLAWQPELRCVLWRCPRCGYIRRDLDLAPAQARGEEYGGDPDADRIRLDITARRLRRRLAADRPDGLGDVLDVGCGRGALAALLAPHARGVVGVDVHADPADPPAARVRLVRGRLEDLDAPAASFDHVVGIHVIEHVEDLAGALGRIRDLLRPGGRAYLLTPWADSLPLRWAGSAWWMLEDPTHRRFLSSASVPLLAERLGFAAAAWRPLVLDSLAVEAATIARRLRPRPGGPGAEESRAVLAAAAAGLPLTLALRAAWPRTRPTLEVVLTAPGRP